LAGFKRLKNQAIRQLEEKIGNLQDFLIARFAGFKRLKIRQLGNQ